jgi:hypothetical protein
MVGKYLLITIILFLFSITASGCSSVKVKRTDIEKTVDLSGSWNDTDSRLTAEELVKDSLEKNWLNDFSMKQGRQPTVIVGTILNRTSELIDPKIFTADLERSLLNSGRVKFVASAQQREELRQEKSDQALHASKETAKPLNQEKGADFLLQGSINSVKDQVKGKYVILYQVNMEMVDLSSNEKVWFGQKEIKKVVSRRAFGL